ncbi:bifunctional diguanylate cyclase/phosphodiesterase [Nocardioides sp. SYSU DS0651]|uniref:sensor domain-containing diguanylate cyclase n=1 Tax=Nocardioides sp. SYSU DS0651 TaxID=3415955 RepID=UPI003F4C0A0A
MSVRPAVRRAEAGATERRRSALAAHALATASLVLGAVILAVYVPLVGGPADGPVYLAGAAYGTLLSCLGALLQPAGRRRAWWALAVAQAFFLVGDVLYVSIERRYGEVPHPSLADPAYLACYPALALGMLWLVRSRQRGSDRSAYLDASILATALTAAGTLFFVSPAAASGGHTMLEETVAAAYPAGDLLVLALVVRLLTTGMVRNVSLWALIGGLAAMLVADLGYVSGVLAETAYAGWVDPVYVASYVLVGYAAVHPSATALTEPATRTSGHIGTGRVVWLGVALVLTPISGFVAAHLDGTVHRGSLTLLIGGCLTALFVVLRIADLLQQLQQKAVQLAALARKDGLTGVANRRTWDHELSRACAFARDHETPLTAAVLDMDHFKRFNDAHGHAMGDLVLKETTAAWAQIVEGRGFLARYGGEEFTVLLPGLAVAEAEALLDRMRRAVSHGQTCSIGMASWHDGDDPAALVARADQALYQAKRSGRNRIVVHDGAAAIPVVATATPDPEPTAPSAHYLPVVELSTGRRLALKATTPPDAPGIRRALSGWDGGGVLTLPVPLGALTDPEVQAALPADLSGIVLDLVVTEGVGLDAATVTALDELRARGASVALDDHGTGRAAMHRLVNLRPDLLRLDMAALRNGNPVIVEALLAAAVLFARHTSATVVAGGIESEEERQQLIRAGVQIGHGPAVLGAGRLTAA